MSCYFIPLTAISIAGLSPDRIASASGLTNFLRIVGGSFGTSLSVTLWERRSAHHHAYLAEKVNTMNTPSNITLDAAHTLGLSDNSSYALVERFIGHQAVMLATNDIFLLCGAIFSVMVFLVWFTKKTQPVQAMGGK